MNLRQLLVLILAPLQFLTSRVHELTGIGQSVGDMARDAPTPATPAGFAFLIWILIFALQTAIAIHQALPSQRDNPLYRRIGWPLALAMAAGNLWMLTAIIYGNGLPLLGLILIMAAAAFITLGRTSAALSTALVPSTRWMRLNAATHAILAGWLTIATFLNLSGVLQLTFGIATGSSLGAMATLTAATLAGGYTLGALRHVPTAAQAYACTLVWGLLAVALANINPALSAIGYTRPMVAIIALVCAATAVIVLALQTMKKGSLSSPS